MNPRIVLVTVRCLRLIPSPSSFNSPGLHHSLKRSSPLQFAYNRKSRFSGNSSSCLADDETATLRHAGRENVSSSSDQLTPDNVNPKVEAELKRFGIEAQILKEGQHHALLCPKCKGGDNSEKSLSLLLNNQRIAWLCHRAKCGWKGSHDLEKAEYAKPQPKLEELNSQWLAFLKQRHISPATALRNKIQQTTTGSVLVFPYYREGELVNAKYRTVDKKFWQERDAEKILYGWDDIRGQSEIIIVEGEMDKLAMEEAGFQNVTSVPDGAPAQIRDGRLPAPKDDKKYAYIWNSLPALEQASRIILATDSDAPGRALAGELARRLGPERCWLATWTPPRAASPPLPAFLGGPAPAPASSFKDANEVLIAAGPKAVQACIRAAIPYPVPGIQSVSNVAVDILREHCEGLPDIAGLSTGWQNLDALYKVRPGCITVVSGRPFAGKSEFTMALLCKLSELHDQFRVGLATFEARDSQETLKCLLEMRVGKPFSARGRAVAMSQAEARLGLDWLSQRFFLIEGEEVGSSTIEYFLNVARIATTRHKLNGLLIDSFQCLRPNSPASHPGLSSFPSTASSVSEFMRQLQAFASTHKLHIWLISHSFSKELTNFLQILSDVAIHIERMDNVIQAGILRSNDKRCSRPGVATFTKEIATRRYHPEE